MSTLHRQLQLSLKVIQLVDPGQKVMGPENVVYSTNPRIATGVDGIKYFLKGPGIEIVAAEALAHMLAGLVDLPVPDFGIARIDEHFFFASREIKVRNVGHFLERGKITNPATLRDTIVFDTWLANIDRNMGNFVGEATSDRGKLRIVPIDFEKSASVRERTPLVRIPMIDHRKFWPSGDLGRIAAGRAIPHGFCQKVEAVTKSQIAHCIGVVASHLAEFRWGDSSLAVLESRSGDIRNLCQEVWR